MPKIKEFIAAHRLQYLVFIAVSLVVIIFTTISYFSNPSAFQPYFGKVNAIVLMVAISLLGIVLLTFLLSRRWFSIFLQGSLKKSLLLSILVILFASIAILIDWRIKFPEEINVSFPVSLLFYTAMGFLVEIIFHLLPLSVLLFLLTSILKNQSDKKLIWCSVFGVALLEPTYQALSMGIYPSWAILGTWINLYVFNLTQLYIFKKYDFISMYAFRLIYYLAWHIIWGQIRLEWLF